MHCYEFVSLYRTGTEVGIITLLINPKKGSINGRKEIIIKRSLVCIGVYVCVCFYEREALYYTLDHTCQRTLRKMSKTWHIGQVRYRGTMRTQSETLGAEVIDLNHGFRTKR